MIERPKVGKEVGETTRVGAFDETIVEESRSSSEEKVGLEALIKEGILDAQLAQMGSNETSIGRHTTVLPEIQVDAGKLKLIHKRQRRYQHMKRLGEGGAGEVDLVQDRDIHRRVALKRTREDKAGDIQLARFVEEVKTIGQLDHPNIVPIHDVGIDENGNHFFTMKYVQGETLKDVIEALRNGDKSYHKRYSYERRTQIFVEILQAIRFAHNQGIIHRDLKPENIMIGEYGEVMVMDWGIAKRIRPPKAHEESGFASLDALPLDPEQGLKGLLEQTSDRAFQTAFGSLVGTPAYMAPEQVQGDSSKLDERTDLYSLCVLFYEFLNLRHPLEHKTTLKDLLWGILEEEPIDSEKLSNPHQGPVPRELCFFLRKGLKKSPDERYQSADEMLVRLQNNLEGKICIHCPSTFLKRSAYEYGHFLDNHRYLGVIYPILLLGVLGVGVWQIVSWLLKALG